MLYIFNSRSDNLTVVLRPTRKVVIGTQVVVEEGLRARFEKGIFLTEDADTAQLLRDKIKKTNDKGVVEIGSEEELAFKRAAGILNIRDSITAPPLSKALNPSLVEQEADSKIICPICDPPKTFKAQRDLNLHLISHRPGMSASKTVEAPRLPPPAEEEDLPGEQPVDIGEPSKS